MVDKDIDDISILEDCLMPHRSIQGQGQLGCIIHPVRSIPTLL